MSKKIYIVGLITVLVFSLLTVTSNAAEEFKVNLDSSSNTISKGSEVTVTLNISDFEDNVEKGISTVTGKISVDDKVFENLTSDSVKKLGNWKVSFDEESGEISCKNLKLAEKAQDVCEITLKAKSDTDSTEGSVKISNLKATAGDAELAAEDAKLEIKIGSTSRISDSSNKNTNNNTTSSVISRISSNSSKNTEDNTADNTNTQNNSSRYSINTNSSNVNTNTNQSTEEKMPNTGLDDSIVKAIVLVAIVGFFGYIKVKSLDK